MRYHVTGIDHAKGSHMTLDIDAPSKAAAEKRANQAERAVRAEALEASVEGRDAGRHDDVVRVHRHRAR